MRILLVCDSSVEREPLERLLSDIGHTVIANIRSSDNVAVIAEAARPNAIVVYVKQHKRQLFSQLETSTRHHPCPVVMFAEKSSGDFAKDSVKAGISAYIVAGFSPERLETILDIAVARFEETRGLRNELNRTREALSDRKVIDKAKGILIAQKGMTEDEAYQTLRRMAMSQNSRMADMAKNLISITEVLSE